MLGVTQVQLETGYYMVDLAELMGSKRKHDAAQRLRDVQLILATNNRALGDAEYKSFMLSLNKSLGVSTEQKFSRSKMEELRMMTQMGGNKAR